MDSASTCPCGRGRNYSQCCLPLHQGAAAADAEALMRSRYSAYALELGEYLRDSWHPSTRPADFDPSQIGDARITWLGLDVKRHQQADMDSAQVEFVARYRVGGASAVRLHERSRFVRENGHWFYLDGEHL